MKKDRFNQLFRTHVREHLSPTPDERKFVTNVYASVQKVIGAQNSIQIGSYPRFTAITPLHDVDILYILGDWNPNAHDPREALEDLEVRLNRDYKNPTDLHAAISRQTHSVTIKFSKGDSDAFAVDVVPAYKHGANSDGADKYVVPEIVAKSRKRRRELNEAVASGQKEMAWIPTDPRGYISAATNLNTSNEDFRKAVKFAKGWRSSCKSADDDFPLKSFHLEQAIATWLQDHPNAQIFDIVFAFFCRLPDLIRYPQIPDRADPSKYIDEYAGNLTEDLRRQVIEARDGFLVKLENFSEGDSVHDLLAVERRKRASTSEAFLFDQGIPMLIEHGFRVIGETLPKPGFPGRILEKLGLIQVDREIKFRTGSDVPAADIYKWKVKNDNCSAMPRGEITDHRTRHSPERTKFEGNHYVECFAIKDGICIGRGRQNVVLKSPWKP